MPSTKKANLVELLKKEIAKKGNPPQAEKPSEKLIPKSKETKNKKKRSKPEVDNEVYVFSFFVKLVVV